MSGYNTNLIRSVSYTVDGLPTKVYNLYLRLRAAVELSSYVGGVVEGYVNRGGLSKPGYTHTQLQLLVGSPVQTIYLNNGLETNYSIGLDYYFSVYVQGGASLQLSIIRGDHTLFYNDQGGGLVKTSFDAFLGEFAQLDFVSTLEADVVEMRAGAGSSRDWLFSGYEDNVISGGANK